MCRDSCLHKIESLNLTGGLIYVREWNNMQYVSSAAFLLAVYSDYLSKAHSSLLCPDAQTQPRDLLNFAKSQVKFCY